MSLKKKVTAPSGAIVSYTYDPIGRPLTETGPDSNNPALTGNVTQYEYLNWGDPDRQKIRKTQPLVAPSGLWEEAYQDGLGRKYKEVKKGDDAQLTKYDGISNRVLMQSLAFHMATESPRWLSYAYDALGRQVKATNPDLTFSQITNNTDGNGKPYTVHNDELGNEKVVWKDAYGNVTQVREKNSGIYTYTTYEFDLRGNLVRAIDAQGNSTTATWDSLGRKLSTTDPDMGTWSYTYDNGGLLLTQRDAKNQVTYFYYDSLGRVTTKYYSGQQVNYYYGGTGTGANIGKLTYVSYPGGSETHSYNLLGLETTSSKCVGGPCKGISQSYDNIGRVTAINYPDGEVVTYNYDDYGRLKNVPNYVSLMNWDAQGQLYCMGLANNTHADFTYDPNRRWLTKAVISGKKDAYTTGTLYEANYTYDATARVTSIQSPTNPYLTENFAYDNLDRLTGVAGNQSQQFGYGSTGNITNNSSQPGNYYTYGDNSHKHAVTAAGGATYAYDANGNMTGGNGRTLGWNVLNQLTSVNVGGQTTTFAYDDRGNRIEKNGPQGTTKYFNKLVETVNGQIVKYYYAGPMLIAKKDNTYWYHSDHLGSTRLMTTSAGMAVKTYDYAAFGDTIAQTSGGPANEHGFTGHHADPESGLIYMGARYYDAKLGRFVIYGHRVYESQHLEIMT